jgi:hypothetical protein
MGGMLRLRGMRLLGRGGMFARVCRWCLSVAWRGRVWYGLDDVIWAGANGDEVQFWQEAPDS